MNKSLGNFYTLRDILVKNYHPITMRYLLLAGHYRQKLNFTFKGLGSAKNSPERIKEFINKLENQNTKCKMTIQSLKLIKNLIFKTEKGFEKAMDDDLNAPKVLAVIFDLIREINNFKEVDKNSTKEILNLF